jgi:Cys-tRNA(Pro)/Cys-tRNA(Cys) deacylase
MSKGIDIAPAEANTTRDHRMKTNAARALEKLGIAYETREYAFDPEDLGAEKVAAAIQMPLSQVFKTLVVLGDRRGPLLAVVAGDMELDLKALARLSTDRRIELAPLKDVQHLTGYLRGGVTALACKKNYPVFVDERITQYSQIAVSAGMRGMQLIVAPEDYLRATDATVGPIARAE